MAALRFLYCVTLGRDWNADLVLPTPKQSNKLPVVPSREEVATLLGSFDALSHGAIFSACYAAGLRISEAVRLRPADIDSQRMVLLVRQGKGAKDRQTLLSPRLLEILRGYWAAPGRPRPGSSRAERRTGTCPPTPLTKPSGEPWHAASRTGGPSVVHRRPPSHQRNAIEWKARERSPCPAPRKRSNPSMA
ncbi:MAG: site-specific integrase [Bryobacterales bacterium]|nr:site-specific integrase [Bryobacterales bacterium]